ncbi:hypothetical protein BCR39DRAFT_249944 [Naematelia encephala]|uniref:Chromo domain-containing protein n=1 Tax=Naematelia encephala TaxID=71784 RepID=A0A1Y2AW11_9TREE|nr:hypothetical protein BCR39DRAFT_249944 [Naematelia encephala]
MGTPKRKAQSGRPLPSKKLHSYAKTSNGAPTIINAAASSPSPEPSVTADATSAVEQSTLLPHCLPPVETTVALHWVYLFYRFCAERHQMWEKREAGVPRDELSTDETMQKTFVGNVFRELDAGSKKMQGIIDTGDQSHEEICFRVFLYCGFYKNTTWDAFVETLGEVPSWKSFNLERYERILHDISFVRREKIYTGGFQIVPPTVYFGREHPLPHYAASLRFIMSLMEMGMPSRLLECRYATDASAILQTAPTLGGFLSLNLLTYLNGSPHLDFEYRNFASCGPGSRLYLQRIFGKSTINSIAMEEAGLRWLYDHQWRFWERIGQDPPHAWTLGLRPGMRVLDFENALCWCHRYVNDFQRKDYRNLGQIPLPDFDLNLTDNASPPAWCDEERYAGVRSTVTAVKTDCTEKEENELKSVTGDAKEGVNGDAESKNVDVQENIISDAQEIVKDDLQDDNEGVYEVEKIVGRKGNRTDRDGLFRVRWRGYLPEDDTWERESSLQEGAKEVLNEWLEWESKVWATIERVAKENPYRAPAVKVQGGGEAAPNRLRLFKRTVVSNDDVSRHKSRRTETLPLKVETVA